MKKPIHLALLKDHYSSKNLFSKDDTVVINVREDNILRYNYAIKPMISNGELVISYIHSNCIQIKCTHVNNSKIETLHFKYDYDNKYYDNDENDYLDKHNDKTISIKDVIYAVKDICTKKNSRKRKYKEKEREDDNHHLPQCDINYNEYKRRRKL